jgi:uncharacterized protein (TIGR02145 family)
MKKLFLLLLIAQVLTACKKDKPAATVSNPALPIADKPVTDKDGNTYKTVKIGTQVWMAENLRTNHYQNGEAITKKTDATWTANTEGYCDPLPAGAGNEYGVLYNGYAAADPRNIAPEGWRVPTENDFKILIAYLGTKGSNPLREKGTLHWELPNEGATNSTGFTAFPCPRRLPSGEYQLLSWGQWWSSTDKIDNTLASYSLSVDSQGNSVSIEAPSKGVGFSVRCVKIAP